MENEKLLSEDLLAKISGGTIPEEVMNNLAMALKLAKMRKYTKEQLINEVTDTFYNSPGTLSDDGSEADLQFLIDYITTNW